MPDFAAIKKGGWHPKGKDGSKESWRGDFKGVDQVSKWMGKGDRKTDGNREEHVARPLATLKDPSAFGPPPKNLNFHGGAAVPNQITPDRQGLGAPLSQDALQARPQETGEYDREEQDAELKPPSLPFRADTTGLKTSHLPPPPGRKDGADGRSLTKGVMVLTPSNFDAVVLGSGKPTFIDFYAPYCKYCKELDPEFEKLADAFESHSNIVTIAKVDVDEHKRLGARFDIQGYPTLKYFDGRSGIPIDYQYNRVYDSLAHFITEKTGALPDIKPPPPSTASRPVIAPRPSVAAPGVKAKPSLPPRLPPRQNSNSKANDSPSTASHGAATREPQAHQGIMNQGALSRLGAAGVSVPGFGIGGKRDALPPPAPPSRTGTRSPPQQSAFSPPEPSVSTNRFAGGHLGELQGRFAKMSTSNKSADAPSQGTSFAQKQTAFKTAQSFKRDPSSVSLSDARNAASTANNFRERHGEQVAAGWKSANALNSKYGLADKVSQYGGPVVGAQTSPAPGMNRSSEVVETQGHTSLVKKAPPPPPKKKAALSVPADAGEGPPPIPLSSKPRPAAVRSNINMIHQDLELDLQSLWFTKNPIAFPPPSIKNLPGSRGYASSSGWSSSGARKTFSFNAIIRHNVDLSTTKVQITWDGANPSMTVKAEQKHIPPPPMLRSADLEQYRSRYSDRVARWCESKMGTQVGNGECWTLAAEALKSVAAEDSRQQAEPCMQSQGLVHGFAVWKWLPPAPEEPRGGVEAAGVARGDVAQFLSCHFKKKNGMGQSWAGAPDHTAVITKVEKGGILRVVESNVGGVKNVQVGQYDFSELVSGEIRIFRAVSETWVGPLDPSWS